MYREQPVRLPALQNKASHEEDTGDQKADSTADVQCSRQRSKRAAFVDIQRTFFEQTLAARSRMARLQREVRQEVTSTNPDREALDQLLVEISAAHTDLERAFVTNLLDSRELLDRDQERRFMHFLRRIRQVRGDVERRFRERWRSMEGRDGPGPGPRGRWRPGQRAPGAEPSSPGNP